MRILVVDDEPEARARCARRVLEHLEITIGVAEGQDRPPADVAVDAHGLAGPVVEDHPIAYHPVQILERCGAGGSVEPVFTPEDVEKLAKLEAQEKKKKTQ